jgi:hypothetical protein
VIEEEFRELYPTDCMFAMVDDEIAHKIWPLVERQLDLHFGPENKAWIDHAILIARNPHASYPISPANFPGHVQFADVGSGNYGWNDGHSL